MTDSFVPKMYRRQLRGWLVSIRETYANRLEFGDVVRHDLADLKPRDLIDIQSFIWVQGSYEYD
jgi:hypothetical protein